MVSSKMNVIITGATGLVGEGVLLHCLENSSIEKILAVGRRKYSMEHPKLKQLIVPDFLKINDYAKELEGYDACFYCAGTSSVGMSEEEYTKITYTATLAFAESILGQNPGMVFCFVSGRSTDASEKGKVMWANVKGKTENALQKMGFKDQYSFRPALMLPSRHQKNPKFYYKIAANLLKYFMPKATIRLAEMGQAMINAVLIGYATHILEVEDIKRLSRLKP